ncbi:MAG: hypothetical protein IKJ19_05030 [Clostridia bacterium]|nr:hypothetical protein [Clostridia bacterium]
MKILNCREKPIEIHGLPFFEEAGFNRLPERVRDKAKCAATMSPYSVGTRICFRTNSPTVYLKFKVKPMNFTPGMSMIAGQSLHVLFGPRNNPLYAGAWTPRDLNTTEMGAPYPFAKKTEHEDVTVYLPRNAIVEDLEVGIDDGYWIDSPTPYDYKPILYYGSSITAGGSCCVPFNAYNAVISHHLNVDYYNFGFSGSCMGEIAIADLIAELDLSIFVFDYDHNAPNADFLQKTHEPFFLRVREKCPNLPIVMISKPDCFGVHADDDIRREIIKATYQNAINRGDKNVYFIDGSTLFGKDDRYACTSDSLHPNDFGHRRMASVIEPVIEKILKNNK